MEGDAISSSPGCGGSRLLSPLARPGPPARWPETSFEGFACKDLDRIVKPSPQDPGSEIASLAFERLPGPIGSTLGTVSTNAEQSPGFRPWRARIVENAVR